MSDKHGTGIEWTHRPGTKGETWNPIRALNVTSGKIGHYCVKVSGGCTNCYAERLQQPYFGNDARYAAQDRGKVTIYLDEETLLRPLHWKTPRTIFVCSMTDAFGEWVTDEQLDRIFAVMALCPQHTFQVLTKRPERMRAYGSDPKTAERVWAAASVLSPSILPALAANGAEWGGATPWPLSNVWLMVSVEDQPTADLRVPLLLETPAAVRGISYEPALGPVDFRKFMWPVHPSWPAKYRSPAEAIAAGAEVNYHRQALVGAWRTFLDWIICGGESGQHARPMHPDWARSARDQCAAAEVPFFMKQWGEWAPAMEGIHLGINPNAATLRSYRQLDEKTCMYRMGKKRAGRLLDGKEHSAFPSPEGRAREAA